MVCGYRYLIVKKKMILRFIARVIFLIRPFKFVGDVPNDVKKAIIIFAPHTSNWDAIYGLSFLLIKKIPFIFTAKKDLMFFPLNILLKYLGAIFIDRTNILKKTGQTAVDLIIKKVKTKDRIYVLLEPEGTRSYAPNWKMGFHKLAISLDVPIILGYIDYEKRELGIGGVYRATSDTEKDLNYLKSFYRKVKGKYPEQGIL